MPRRFGYNRDFIVPARVSPTGKFVPPSQTVADLLASRLVVETRRKQPVDQRDGDTFLRASLNLTEGSPVKLGNRNIADKGHLFLKTWRRSR